MTWLYCGCSDIHQMGQSHVKAPEEVLLDEGKLRLLITIRVQAFFQDKRLQYPPIDTPRDRKHNGDRANGMTYALDDTAWDALRFDAHTCSFTYPVNEHDSRTIAYSSKLKKVVRLDRLAN